MQEQAGGGVILSAPVGEDLVDYRKMKGRWGERERGRELCESITA